MPTVQTTKEELIQEEILQAALKLFQKYGLYKVTMDDIAKFVGKSRSSLYYYYKSRDEVFDAVMSAIIREVMKEITNLVDEAKTTEKKIQAFCIAKLKTSAERRALFSALEAGMGAEEITKHTQAMSAIHQRIMDWESEFIKQILSYGEKKGEINPLKKKKQETLIFVLLSSIRGIRREMAHDNDFSKSAEAVGTLTHMFMLALS